VGQALATEAIEECVRSGSVWEAESNMEWLDLVSTPAAADWDASFTVERINLSQNIAKAFQRKCEFDQMREVPFVRKPDELVLATSHLAQSPSASRVIRRTSRIFHLVLSGSDKPAHAGALLSRPRQRSFFGRPILRVTRPPLGLLFWS
jgi:hypothetical protein